MLREHRVAAGLNQEELAYRAGLSARALGDIERGACLRPQRHTLSRLADALALAPGAQEALEAAIARRRGPRAARGHARTDEECRLQAPATPLIGRRAELDTLGGLLESGHPRLITVTGPGGVGKTHLAWAALGAFGSRRADSTHAISLAHVRDPRDVAGAIAGALNLRATGGRTAHERVIRHLRERSALLLLDTFEALTDAAHLLADILASCVRVRLLVTSRASLGIRGEHLFGLTPLPLPEPGHDGLGAEPSALALFAQRVRALRNDDPWDTDAIAAAREVCRRLDGLPLALELASRSRLLSPCTLLERLDCPLEMLPEGPRDLPARQRTLRASAQWSYDLLTPAQQVLFARLAVFPDGCSLGEAGVICGQVGALRIDVWRETEGLARLSLVQPARGDPSGRQGPRLTMLRTVRAFADERLRASAEEEALRRRLAGYRTEM